MANFKVESGIQLLARLRRRPNVHFVYPILFEGGPKPGDVIEIILNEDNPIYILTDLISEALMPTSLGGVETGVLFFSTDGNMNFQELGNSVRRKLLARIANSSQDHEEYTDEDLSSLLQATLSNFHLLEIYDATQLYTTLHNLDSILNEHPNISLLLFDTLTAFYWSEQGFKITKMDVYLKNLLRMIQKITKEYKITLIYTRPEYFSSSKEAFKNSEKGPDEPALENLNFRIHLIENGDKSYQVNIQSSSKIYKKYFHVSNNEIKWS